MTVIRKVHHGRNVWGESGLVGKHRSHSLCFKCARLKYHDAEKNCPIAQELYELCVRQNLVTPVYECPEFQPKRS